jgi:hypothetical protein
MKELCQDDNYAWISAHEKNSPEYSPSHAKEATPATFGRASLVSRLPRTFSQAATYCIQRTMKLNFQPVFSKY